MSPQVRRSTGLAVRCASGVAATSVTTSSAHAAGVTPTNGSNGTNGSSHASAASAATAATATAATLSGRTSCSRLGRLGLLRTHQPSRPSSSLRSQARRIITLSLSPASSAPLSTSAFSTRACFSTAAVYSSSTSLSHLASSPSPSSSPSSPSSSTTPDLGSNIASVRCVLLHLAPVRSRIRTLPVIMGSALKQTRDHGDHGHGHSHSGHGHHHHHHDNTYLTSANTSDPGVRITRLGLLSNLGMAIAKFIGGWAFNSRSMTADAWHSIADLTSDILTLATLSWSLKRPSDRFPMGFGKIESLGSLGVSGMLLVGGFYMGWESAISLYGHFNPEGAHHIFEHIGHGHSHSHSPVDLGIPNIHAVWLAAGTILIKEWLYHATMKVALERKSSVLASNAVHHRVDSLTGIVTLAAILGANVFEHAAWLDPVGGLLISIMVVNAGYENTKEALYELADRSLDDEVKKSVRKQAHRALANVSEGHEAELRDVSGIKSGQNYLVDLELAVPGAWTVNDVKDVEDAVRLQIGSKVRGVRRLRVRFVSRDEPVKEKWDEFIAGSEALQKPEGQEEEEEEEEEEEGGGSNRH